MLLSWVDLNVSIWLWSSFISLVCSRALVKREMEGFQKHLGPRCILLKNKWKSNRIVPAVHLFYSSTIIPGKRGPYPGMLTCFFWRSDPRNFTWRGPCSLCTCRGLTSTLPLSVARIVSPMSPSSALSQFCFDSVTDYGAWAVLELIISPDRSCTWICLPAPSSRC